MILCTGLWLNITSRCINVTFSPRYVSALIFDKTMAVTSSGICPPVRKAMKIEYVTHKVTIKALVLDSDVGFTTPFSDLEWPALRVLDIIVHSATNQLLGIKQGIHW